MKSDLWADEFLDFMQVVENGASKYKPDGWLDTDGHGTSHKDMHASMFRHLADSHAGKLVDHDSGLHPLLHLATRSLMLYTRQKRGIVHPDDEKKVYKNPWGGALQDSYAQASKEIDDGWETL